MTVFEAGTRAHTLDFEEGDVGYVLQSNPHYIENTGDTDLVFLEMFKGDHYEDISLGEWMAHTPHLRSISICTWGNRCSMRSRKKKR
jgi:oxalate decarboxylase